MADEQTPYAPLTGNLHPALDAFANGMETEGGREWASTATNQLQDHFDAQALATHVDQAGHALVNNVASFKQGAADYVRKDPTALDTVLDIVPHTMQAIAGVHPDPDEAAGAASDLTKHIQGEVVKSAIQTYAERDGATAAKALDKYRDYLDPADAKGLGDYISNMANMRQADYEGARRDQLRQIAGQSDASAIGHLQTLAHPDTGQLTFPPAWGQKMMSDESILPQTKGSLLNAYAALQVNGEPAQPDPNTVSNLLQRSALPPGSPNHPTVGEVVQQVGRTLSASDGAWLAAKMGPQTPATRAENQALADTLSTARSQIGNKDAYQRFVSWFLPSYQRAVSGGMPYQDALSPESKGYVLSPGRMQQFQPTGSDLIKPARQLPPGTKRPSLQQIFGGR